MSTFKMRMTAIVTGASLILAVLMVASPPAFAHDAYRTVHAGRWSDIRFGDTISQARNRGAVIRFNPRRDGPWERGCSYARVVHHSRRVGWVMVWRVNGRAIIKSASFHRLRSKPRVSTATGVEFGTTEAALLRRATRRGWDVSVRRHAYGGPGSHYIMHRVARRDGHMLTYKYETTRFNGAVRVSAIHAGHRDATRVIEGCY